MEYNCCLSGWQLIEAFPKPRNKTGGFWSPFEFPVGESTKSKTYKRYIGLLERVIWSPSSSRTDTDPDDDDQADGDDGTADATGMPLYSVPLSSLPAATTVCLARFAPLIIFNPSSSPLPPCPSPCPPSCGLSHVPLCARASALLSATIFRASARFLHTRHQGMDIHQNFGYLWECRGSFAITTTAQLLLESMLCRTMEHGALAQRLRILK